MVSLSIDVASSAPKASAQARAGKSDQNSANDDFGALVDSNVADASAAAPADTAPLRTQPTSRGESSSSTGEKKDQAPQKTVAASDKPNEPVMAQTDAAVAIDVTIETPVVAITPEIIASIAAGILPVEDPAATADPLTDADAAATAEAVAAQPVVTGVVAPVAAMPVVAAAIAVDAAPVSSAEPVTIDAASTATTPAVETEANPAPAPAATTEQPTEPQAITVAAVAAATKPKAAETSQADIETKTETKGATASVETKAQASAELPAVEAKPAPKADTIEKPVAKVEAKTERAAQPDAATPVSDPRSASTTEARLDASPATSASTAPTTPLTQQVATTQPQAGANASVVPPPINASVQLASNVAVPISGLAVNIAFNANAGRSRFDIRLDPAELGRIDVRLDVDRNGQVTSHLTVERPSTLDMLRRDAPQLQRALEDAGLKTGDSGLQFSLRDQSQQQAGSDDRSSRGQPYRLVVDELPALPAEAGRSYARLAAARGGVDIRI